MQLNTNRINNRICRKEAWTSITRCLHLCAQCVDLQAIGINLKVSTVVSSISVLCAFAFLVVLIKTYAGGAAGLIRSLWDKFCPSREQPCAILNLTVPDIFFLRAVHRSRSLAPVFFSRVFIFFIFLFFVCFLILIHDSMNTLTLDPSSEIRSPFITLPDRTGPPLDTFLSLPYPCLLHRNWARARHTPVY